MENSMVAERFKWRNPRTDPLPRIVNFLKKFYTLFLSPVGSAW